MDNLMNFYKDRNVFITGHTGFKGSWLSKFLINTGAKVYGIALNPEKLSLYNLLKFFIASNALFWSLLDFHS